MTADRPRGWAPRRSGRSTTTVPSASSASQLRVCLMIKAIPGHSRCRPVGRIEQCGVAEQQLLSQLFRELRILELCRPKHWADEGRQRPPARDSGSPAVCSRAWDPSDCSFEQRAMIDRRVRIVLGRLHGPSSYSSLLMSRLVQPVPTQAAPILRAVGGHAGKRARDDPGQVLRRPG